LLYTKFSVTQCEPELGVPSLKLSFVDAKVLDLCSSRDALVREYGSALARKICCRLALLVAAPTLACVPLAPPVGLMRVGSQGRFAVAVGAGHSLEFYTLPKETLEMSDLSQISKLLIIGLFANRSAKAVH
jgi:hypothetical protein